MISCDRTAPIKSAGTILVYFYPTFRTLTVTDKQKADLVVHKN
ncbi:hypothetical protein GXM_09481 [Nostoc sphaeroides CCNUC1]|uniref:Uncharacterized protein n=1 Tax=Nostoc sphaeroides CCNUC1 TaxID=2653204 RepID=A0A5P8WGL3_9NOSO|nr:hypothetical protein GXM_09481 [Nostoc sphaeroides CCNUC1]